jgi:hypothetical protein
MSLNPYEIRLELLKLAQTTLNEKAYHSRQALMDQYTYERENSPNIAFPKLPTMPTSEEIIAEAKKLNDFVSNSQ